MNIRALVEEEDDDWHVTTPGGGDEGGEPVLVTSVHISSLRQGSKKIFNEFFHRGSLLPNSINEDLKINRIFHQVKNPFPLFLFFVQKYVVF